MSFCLSVSVKDLFSLTDCSVLKDHKDIIELLSDGNVEDTAKAFLFLKKITKAKIILTLRPVFLGGSFVGNEEKRCQVIFELLSLFSPDYLDLESFLPRNFIFSIKRFYPHVEIILSYHNFSWKPVNLQSFFSSIRNDFVSYYKIASVVKSFEELLLFINFLKKSDNLIMVILGKKWSWTRILLPFLGSCWSYCALDGKERFGQLSLDSLMKEYKINRNFCCIPNVYALLGDFKGVSRSPGHIFHNEYFFNSLNNSLYLKIPIDKDELGSFVSFSKKFNFFKGFSVTSPLKKDIVLYLDKLNLEALEIGAVNTIKISKKKKWIGYNTDGIGVFDYLQDIYGDLTFKTVAILGSGGSAFSILYEGLKRCLKVFVFARNEKERKVIEKRFSFVNTSGLNNFSANNFDIIINTMPPDVDMEFVQPTSKNIVFDISKSNFYLTPLIKKALKKNSKIAYGYGMFIYQAIYQHKLWNNIF